MRVKAASAAVALVLALAVPAALDVAGRPFLVNLVTKIAVMSAAVVSLDLIVGFGGLLSLGHAAFFGLAAYCVGVLAVGGVTSIWIQLPAAAGLAAAAALIMGLIAVRTAGIYFLMITLALAQLLYYLAVGSERLGGDDGFALPRSVLGGGLAFDQPIVLCYASVAALALVLYAARRLVQSQFGRALQGVRSNEPRMRALGYDSFRIKLAAFVVAGAMCGVAGALFVNLKAYVSPAYMHWTRSGELLVMLLLGGIGTLNGALAGVVVFEAFETFLPPLLERWHSGSGGNWMLLFGPFLIAVALLSRRGVAGLFARWWPAAAVDAMSRERSSQSDPGIAPDEDVPAPAQVHRTEERSPGRLQIRALRKTFGGLVATDGVTLDVPPGEFHAIIGPNGAGKTTLMAQIGGEQDPDQGEILVDGHPLTGMPVHRRARLGIGRACQMSSILKDFTVLENVALAVQARQRPALHPWRNANDPRFTEPAREALRQVELLSRAETLAGDLVHGEQRRLELAMVLAMHPRVLLLDEPLAGAGSEESKQLLATLRSLRGRYTVILIEHDVDAVFELADRVTVLLYGRIIASGSPDDVRTDQAVQVAYLGAGNE